LIIPKYHGVIKTKLRAKLLYKNQGKEKIIYSNEFDGNINPAQFWHQPNRSFYKMKPCQI
jgi:hypothetical protein